MSLDYDYIGQTYSYSFVYIKVLLLCIRYIQASNLLFARF